MKFKKQDKIKCLLWCNRHCCLCYKKCDTDIELAHIESNASGGSNVLDNAIPLCYDCHSKIGRYNNDHPRGNKYHPDELKARREQVYEEQTRHLVPPIHFEITQQSRKLPDVGFIIAHKGSSLPVEALVQIKFFLGTKNLGIGERHYSGKKKWKLNPGFTIMGHFPVPSEVLSSKKTLQIEVSVSVIDCYSREHHLLPNTWVYIRKTNAWFLEP